MKECPEYQEITAHFAKEINNSESVKVEHRSFIVTSMYVSRRQQNELEASHGIKVKIRASAKVRERALDLRDHL